MNSANQILFLTCFLLLAVKFSMTSADKWLKQELDELEEAQRMINDAISTFDDPTPFIDSQGN